MSVDDQTPQVRLEDKSQSGLREQLGRFLKYRNGKVNSRKKIAISSALIAVAILPALFRGSPEMPEGGGRGVVLPDNPGQGQSGDEFIFSDYSRTDEARSQDDAKRTASRMPHGKPERMLGPQLVARPRNVKIPPGSMVKATLISGASNGLVKAQILEPLSLNGEVLIEQGTIAVGRGSSTEDRLFIQFSKLVFKDGAVDTVQAEAADQSDQIVGLKGSKLGHYAARLGAGIGLNFVGGFSEALQETEGQDGVLVKKPTVRNALLNGAARASLEQSQEMMSNLKNQQPIIEVKAGTAILIMFSDSGG